MQKISALNIICLDQFNSIKLKFDPINIVSIFIQMLSNPFSTQHLIKFSYY